MSIQKSTWIFLSIATLFSIGLIYRYFDTVVPFVHLNVTMDKSQAISKACEVASLNQWDIQDFEIAVEFKDESKLQAFVELEGGGKKAFVDMIEQNLYQPYAWRVRFYKPATIQEYIINFTPDGVAYEFACKTPEDQKGASLSKDQALRVAMDGVAAWNVVDMSLYNSIEYRSIVQPSGRVDHTFVYQRDDIHLGDGLYRLQLMVQGDVFSGLDRHIKIPDEFNRRYKQMFANNILLASTTQYVAIFLYVFVIGLLLAIFFYRDRRFLYLKQHGILAFVFAIIMALASFNRWPLIWNYYPTHMSKLIFMGYQLFGVLIGTIVFSVVIYAFTVLVDAADRFVFGRHIQFLKSWKLSVAGTRQVFDMTILGYLSVGILLGYEILYSLWAQHMGWWAPLSTLVDPNILSTTFPFFTPIATAFRAGFFEEFVTRGLPIAGMLFLTRNSRFKGLWFIAIMIIQALIFGGLHANYPQQPCYYRIIELFGHSFLFGTLYYWFGLLPGIIAHYVYDAVLMCIPIWVSGLFVQKIIAILFMALPLLVVLIAWMRQGFQLQDAASAAYNDAHNYQDPLDEPQSFHREVGQPVSSKTLVVFTILGLIGTGLLYFSWHKLMVVPPVSISAKEAEKKAHDIIQEYKNVSNEPWTVIVQLVNTAGIDGNKFIWQKYGKDAYLDFYGKYVVPSYWLVSWKKFVGDVEDRAEQLAVMIDCQGSVLGIRHVLPESKSGADLSDVHAQKIAKEQIQKFYELDSKDLELVSCESTKHLRRRDFTVIYKDIANYHFDDGQARIYVELSGDELSLIQRKIYAPELWQRTEQDRVSKQTIFKIVGFIWIMLTCLLSMILAFGTYGLHIRLVIPVIFLSVVYVLINCVKLINNWNEVLGCFNTSEPFTYQCIRVFMSQTMMSFMSGFGLAILLVLLALYNKKSSDKNWLSIGSYFTVGLGLGCFEVWLSQFQCLHEVPVGMQSFYGTMYPALAMLLTYFLQHVLFNTMIFAAFCTVAYWLQQRCATWGLIVYFMMTGIMTSSFADIANVELWLGSGIIMGLFWWILYRYIVSRNIDCLMWIMFGMTVAGILPSVLFAMYPMIAQHFALSFGLFFAFLIWVYRKI